MNILVFLVVFSKFYFVLTYGPQSNEEFYTKCVNAIYRECTHQSEFTEQEIENARIYIQNRFNNLPNPAYRPVRPPCKKLNVRKDFKCLTHREKLELIAALKELYRNGEQTRLALWPHAVYWGITHQFGEDFFPGHRWMIHEWEKSIKRINPKINLPYWTPYEDYDQPELGILWDYLGRAGNRESNYCVTDGPFVNVKPCVKRKWINDTYMRSWNPIEYYDSSLQYPDIANANIPAHFKVHNAVGGSEGQMSVPNAPYDFSFWPMHEFEQVAHFKWRLQNGQQLVPELYNQGLVYDWEIDRIRPANLTRDRLIYFNVSILEAYHETFGELCSIDDVIIEAINEITSNKRREMPFNYKKMPKDLLKKYYPKFYSGNYGPFDYLSHPVMDCNRQCRPIRQAEELGSNIEGRRFLARTKYLALLNRQDVVLSQERQYTDLTDEMKRKGYCSPYIIS